MPTMRLPPLTLTAFDVAWVHWPDPALDPVQPPATPVIIDTDGNGTPDTQVPWTAPGGSTAYPRVQATVCNCSSASPQDTANDLFLIPGEVGGWWGGPATDSLPATGSCGDCTTDGVVTVTDALCIARITVGLTTASPLTILLADVDQDGDLDIIDALWVAQYTLALRPPLGCDGQLGGTMLTCAGSRGTGGIPFEFEVHGPTPDVTVTVDCSADQGRTWQPATPYGTSPPPLDVNPATGVPTGSPVTFIWASNTDLPQAMVTILRFHIDDGLGTTDLFSSSRGGPNVAAPTCTITGPGAGYHTGDITITFDVDDVDGDPVWPLVAFNDGGGWFLGSPSVSQIESNFPRPAPSTWNQFVWDSALDLPGYTGGVWIGVNVWDGIAQDGCMIQIDVTN
jgi:hypothetical protein